MSETEIAITKLLTKRYDDAATRSERAVKAMLTAFPEAMVLNHESFLGAANLPDPDDQHVLAAALKTRASMIVTENVKDFPSSTLASLNLEAKTADEFIADAVDLDPNLAIGALRDMRQRLKNPNLTSNEMLARMESVGLASAASVLRPFSKLL